MKATIIITTEVHSRYTGTLSEDGGVHIDKREQSFDDGATYIETSGFNGTVKGGLDAIDAALAVENINLRLFHVERDPGQVIVMPYDIERPASGDYGVSFVVGYDLVYSIDLTPSDEAYAGMLRTFVEQVLSDVKLARRNDDTALLAEALVIATWLGKSSPELLVPIIEDLRDRGDRL